MQITIIYYTLCSEALYLHSCDRQECCLKARKWFIYCPRLLVDSRLGIMHITNWPWRKSGRVMYTQDISLSNKTSEGLFYCSQFGYERSNNDADHKPYLCLDDLWNIRLIIWNPPLPLWVTLIHRQKYFIAASLVMKAAIMWRIINHICV